MNEFWTWIVLGIAAAVILAGLVTGYVLRRRDVARRHARASTTGGRRGPDTDNGRDRKSKTPAGVSGHLRE